MSFWDGSFFNYYVSDLNEEAPIEYSYGTIDLNAEPNADVGFDSQASYGFVYDDNWGVLGDCGEAERARAILGEDTPWTRLFDLAELPSYRLITVEFLSTFRYRAHQATVRVDEDAELPPNIEFSLCGQHFEMSIERFAVHMGIYYEPETVTDGFAQGLTQREEGVMRAWWAQISDTPFTGHRVRATMIRDPLIRYIHRCIVTTISGRGQSQEQAVQPSTALRLVLRLLLPPSGALYTVGWLLHHPHCPNERHG
ncbi:hypothetical protein R6Q57_027720 [Mikania cordata]